MKTTMVIDAEAIKGVRLTQPQLKLLREIFEAKDGFACVDTYKPLLKLLELGLVEMRAKGKFWHSTYVVTDKVQAVRKESAS